LKQWNGLCGLAIRPCQAIHSSVQTLHVHWPVWRCGWCILSASAPCDIVTESPEFKNSALNSEVKYAQPSRKCKFKRRGIGHRNARLHSSSAPLAE